jgi:hypothetical protein
MPTGSIIYELPLWALAILIVLVLIGALETGFHLGRRAQQDKVESGHLATLQAAVLGLLALVLAFTYSYVSSRLDTRKNAVIAEANAIGTAYLRADFAPPQQRDRLHRLLAEYARTRLVTYESVGTLEGLKAVVARSLAVQKQLWPVVDEAMKNSPDGPKEALLAQAVNDVIDLHTVRLTAGFDVLPAIVFIMLLVVGALAMLITGYSAGLKGKPDRWISISFAGVLAFIIVLIADLDNPLRGFVHVSQQPLADLVKSLEAAQAGT